MRKLDEIISYIIGELYRRLNPDSITRYYKDYMNDEISFNIYKGTYHKIYRLPISSLLKLNFNNVEEYIYYLEKEFYEE